MSFDAFARDLQSFFTELESLNSSLVVTADPTAGACRLTLQVGTPAGRHEQYVVSLEADQAQSRQQTAA